MGFSPSCIVPDLLTGLQSNFITPVDTALHHAAMGGHPHYVEFFLENGADKDIVNKKGESALIVALKSVPFNAMQRERSVVSDSRLSGQSVRHGECSNPVS